MHDDSMGSIPTSSVYMFQIYTNLSTSLDTHHLFDEYPQECFRFKVVNCLGYICGNCK